ncbi:hypothetical protein Hanom_Chr14g01304811 [Helianthus anomalus]
MQSNLMIKAVKLQTLPDSRLWVARMSPPGPLETSSSIYEAHSLKQWCVSLMLLCKGDSTPSE